MGRKEKIAQIEQEISEGKLGVARDRLHGLVTAYPLDLDLRKRLGDVYWKLGYSIEAGRFWFLQDDLDEQGQEAVAAFLNSCGHDPVSVLRRLKLKGAPADFADKTARRRIEEQIEECRRRGLEPPVSEVPSRRPRDRGTGLAIGTCLSVLLLVLVLAVVGFIAVVRTVTGR